MNPEQVLTNTVRRCRERGVIIPTYRQLIDPTQISGHIQDELRGIGLWDVHPRNLFRLNWKNEPVRHGGGFGGVNFLELPSSFTGVSARIFVLLGKFFPTGSHKVGATFGPLVEKLVSGHFDPTTQKALWPSTGNYCRGGAYDSTLLGCHSIAVLPEEMSEERFAWLEEIGAEVVRTPGCESNVKEIYDETKRLKAARGDEIVVLNQFSDFGNPMWHYHVTGRAMQEVFEQQKREDERFFGVFLTQGSAGTLASGDYLKTVWPALKLGAGEALQCPTLLSNGYGGHRIEGIGDKHVPWVHNLRNTDLVAAIDDNACMSLMRLCNEPTGREVLARAGVPRPLTDRLDLLGISSIANVLGCIKMAKYYELGERDCLFTVATDSMELYGSRLDEARQRYGEYTHAHAEADYAHWLLGERTDNMLELRYEDRRRMHNLKYFTWVEQQGKDVADLNAQWYDPDYWERIWSRVDKWDEEIEEFNERVRG
ncbi:MAG: pyridoxal-phosphate dependent enzyme [Candidatus Cloacimonetes bacterium]|nr:pyridoxal-phosphate dependent enzyme [Candidatus Cloacimonadota bacterium]